jgi:hypothetical protein
MKIKVPDGAEGKRVKCPGCQSALLITEEGLERAQKQTVQSAAAKSRRDRGEDEDEPRAKKRWQDDDDDYDDEPRSKRRRDDDDDDDYRPAKKRKKSGGGMPMWVWLAGGGGLVAVVLVVLFVFVLGGGAAKTKFKDVKEGMTEKEVIDLVGEPHSGSTKNNAQWFNPKMTAADASSPKAANLNETLSVVFINGKVAMVVYVDVAKAKQEMEKALKGSGF